MNSVPLSISDANLRAFCNRHAIVKLALFGSILRDDFSPESDIDVLVAFAPGVPVGLIRLGTVEAALSDLLGRRVDMNMPDMLSKYFRDEVLAESRTLYDAA